MINAEHLAILSKGVETWNKWRVLHPHIRPDLTEANFRGVRLPKIDFADVDLRHADLSEAFLNHSKLSSAQLTGAILTEANLSASDLSKASLSEISAFGTDLSGANLQDVKLYRANLGGANLTGANLSRASLFRANLLRSDLVRADFTYADLSCANLQEATLAGATLTGATLWETQRARWSIQGVICERAYWDEDSGTVTEYAPGEFERLYSHQTSIEVFYKGGISTFELNTLPALLQHLASKHPDANIQLKTVEQTGGGAKITINLGDADDSLKEEIEADARQVVTAQLQLRDNDVLRLQIENATLRQMHESTIRLMLASSAPQITFNAPVHTAALPSGNASVEIHQTFNDNTALIQLIDKILTHNTELTTTQSTEVREAKAELQKPEPQKSRLSSFYDFLKTLPKEAILKGAGKLGEKAAEADWSSLLHQLGEFIHHLH